MRNRTAVKDWALAVCLIAGGLRIASAAETNSAPADRAVVELGTCKLTLMSTYAWRDWQPIVEHPGPDGGSPLYAKVGFTVANMGPDAITLTYRAVIVDENGKSHAATFKTLPNYSVIPDAAVESYRKLDEKGKQEVRAKYNVQWDGSLKPAESRLVEIITHDGPPLPVGSHLRVEVTWTDSKGHAVVVSTPAAAVERTD